MTDPNFILHYVNDPEKSAVFYTKILDKDPVDRSPTFVMYALESGVMLGLWAKNTVEPAVDDCCPIGELAFSVENKQVVLKTYEKWQRQGVNIIQPPTDMDFGHTFVGLDPDGHRLRVFAPMTT